MLGENAVVTFLLTDIEGSTRLWEEDPQAMAAALLIHDAIAQEVIGQHSGTLVKPRGEGDSLFIVFDSPLHAVVCAAALQRRLSAATWPTSRPIRARMAVHTGAANHWEGDYYGQTVNRCARIRGVGHGEQVLVSEATAMFTERDLRDGLALRDLGYHRLKDLAQPEHIHQLLHDDLRADFPPLASLQQESTNLPIQVSSFVGRSEELSQIHRQMTKSRLVSLVGLSGMGKSRLALQSAADAVDRFPDGVWHVDVALSGGNLLLPAIARFFGAELKDPNDVRELAGVIGKKKALVLLDNLERQADSARIIQQLLSSCDHLQFLATAHTKLNIPGEAIFNVPALRCPPSGTRQMTEIETADAVRLFVERAQLVAPNFTLHPGNAGLAASIVAQLDGHALGIELAAARLKALTVEDLAKRLRADLRIAGGGDSGPITKILEWAWANLGAPEEALLGKLTVFVGHFSLAAAEEVIADDILEPLGALVDDGLVQFQDLAGKTTYRLLKPVADFARRKSVPDESLIERHAETYAQLTRDEHHAHEASDFKTYLDEIEYAIDNIRHALEWFAEHRPAELVRIAFALFRYWEARGYSAEGRRWCELAIENAPKEPNPELSATINAGACLAGRVGDFGAARLLHQQALEMREALRDSIGIAASINNLANVENELGNLKEALDLYQRAIELNRELGNQNYVAINLVNMGTVANRLRDFERGLALHRESEQQFSAIGSKRGRLYPLASMGNSLAGLTRFSEARGAYREAAALCQEFGDQPWLCICLEGMAQVYLGEGDLDGFAECRIAASKLRAEVDLPPSPSDEEDSAMQLKWAQDQWGAPSVAAAISRAELLGWKTVAESRIK